MQSCLTLAFKRQQQEYYRWLSEVRVRGDWEGWTAFVLACVRVAADDGVETARRPFAQLNGDRSTVLYHRATTISAARLFDLLPQNPMMMVQKTSELLKTTKPTAAKAIDALCQGGVLQEVTGKRRDRVYAYQAYLNILAEETA